MRRKSTRVGGERVTAREVRGGRHNRNDVIESANSTRKGKKHIGSPESHLTASGTTFTPRATLMHTCNIHNILSRDFLTLSHRYLLSTRLSELQLRTTEAQVQGRVLLSTSRRAPVVEASKENRLLVPRLLRGRRHRARRIRTGLRGLKLLKVLRIGLAEDGRRVWWLQVAQPFPVDAGEKGVCLDGLDPNAVFAPSE